MTTPTNENSATAAPAPRRNVAPMLAVGLAALVIGAGGSWMLARRMPPDPAAEARADATSAPHEAPLAERIADLDPFVVNVEGEGFKRFLKTRLQIETATPEDRRMIESRVPQIRDAVIVLLASKRLDDLDGFEGKAVLKNELAERIGDLVGPERIRSVLITEFVIQ
jgi:flagellar FliL protein